MKKLKITLLSLLSIIVIALLGCTIYLNVGYNSLPEAYEYLESTSEVTVNDSKDYIEFIPSTKTDKLIIFYQGAKVDEKSYSKLMFDIAKCNIKVAIVKSTLNFALLSSNKAYAYALAHEGYEIYLMGHSLGGVVCSNLIAKYDIFDGLILLASYPNKDISQKDVRVLSIYGKFDGVLNKEKYKENKAYLPNTALEVLLMEGNHSYFGMYGLQKHDNDSIKNLEQIELTKSSIVRFINGNQ